MLEDCDELITSTAKDRSGQGLARLLNLTDGLLGQGLSLLVAITTNEPLTSLHAAIARAGRCIAEIEVGLLGEAEARAWLGRDLPARPQGGSCWPSWSHPGRDRTGAGPHRRPAGRPVPERSGPSPPLGVHERGSQGWSGSTVAVGAAKAPFPDDADGDVVVVVVGATGVTARRRPRSGSWWPAARSR